MNLWSISRIARFRAVIFFICFELYYFTSLPVMLFWMLCVIPSEIKYQFLAKPWAELFWFKNLVSFKFCRTLLYWIWIFKKGQNCYKRNFGLATIQMDARYYKRFRISFGTIWLFFCSNKKCVVYLTWFATAIHTVNPQSEVDL